MDAREELNLVFRERNRLEFERMLSSPALADLLSGLSVSVGDARDLLFWVYSYSSRQTLEVFKTAAAELVKDPRKIKDFLRVK